MNTPRTREPRRYKGPPENNAPEGEYVKAIFNDDIRLHVGFLITVWPHVEEEMIGVFKTIVGIKDDQTARLAFRSIIAEAARIKIMKTVLEKSPLYADQEPWIDELLDEFRSLSMVRNHYAHGLWYTLMPSRRVFLEEDAELADRFLQKREVTLNEATRNFEWVDNLMKRLKEFNEANGPSLGEMYAKALLAGTPPPKLKAPHTPRFGAKAPR